jgi:hypothetical protein
MILGMEGVETHRDWACKVLGIQGEARAYLQEGSCGERRQ